MQASKKENEAVVFSNEELTCITSVEEKQFFIYGDEPQPEPGADGKEIR